MVNTESKSELDLWELENGFVSHLDPEPFISYQKKLDCWTLQEGIALHLCPELLIPELADAEHIAKIVREVDLLMFYRAIDAETLKVKGYDAEKVKNWDVKNSSPMDPTDFGDYEECRVGAGQRWRDCYSDLKVNPFEFLEFVRKKGLFDIHPDLAYVKHPSKSGEVKYSWKSDTQPDDEATTAPLKWTGITATFLNENEILFQFSGDSFEKDYRQLGFADGRNGQPRKSWTCFLDASTQDGKIRYSMLNRPAVEKDVEFLRKKLRELFPDVDGDPIPHNSGCYNFEIHLKNNFAEK